MSEEAVAQTEAPAAEATSETAKILSNRDELLAKFKQFKADKAAKEAAPAAETTEPATEEPSKEEPSAKKAERDIDLEHAKLLNKHADVVEELRLARAANKSAEAEAKAFKALQADAKSDPAKAIAVFEKLMGKSYNAFNQWVIDNADKVRAAAKSSSIPDEYRTELETLRAEREARETEKKTTEQRAALTTYSGSVQKWLGENADDYPLTSQFEFAAQQLAGEQGVGKVRPEHVKALESRLEENILEVLTEKTLRHLVSKHDKVKQIVSALTGTAAKSSPVTASPKGNQPASSEGPKALGNSSASAATTQAPSGKDATRAALMDGLRKIREANATK